VTTGIGWHRHPAGWWVWGVAAGEGCALCDEADAWALERARAAPVVELAPAPVREPAQTLASALAARRAKRATNQGDLF
jgi:hypothetical protein